AAVAKLQHRREHGAEPRVVRDLGPVHRHVEIDPDQDLLSGQLIRQIVECLQAGHAQPSLAIAQAESTIRFEKPHSLSYQLTTRTSLPSRTAVSRLSTVELALVCMRSIETTGSSVAARGALWGLGLERAFAC